MTLNNLSCPRLHHLRFISYLPDELGQGPSQDEASHLSSLVLKVLRIELSPSELRHLNFISSNFRRISPKKDWTCMTPTLKVRVYVTVLIRENLPFRNN